MSCLRHYIILILVTVLLAGIAREAAAHAMVDHAEPKVGSKIAQSPREIKIWFSGDIEPAFSSIQVFDADGNQVDKKDTHIDPNDKTCLIVSLPALNTGLYKVSWRATSIDTHKTKGEFKFEVAP